MRIATLSIGDELLCGEIIDTNASAIAARLYERGFCVDRHYTVGDDTELIAEALLLLAENHDAVVVTGGLGPTSDDLTAAAVAEATNDALVLNETASAHLADFFKRRGRDLFPQNEKQALLPSRAAIIPNPRGTACGFHMNVNNCTIYCLPGVPSEMTLMLDETVVPEICKASGSQGILRTKTLKVFGISEAEVGRITEGIQMPGIKLAYCVEFPIINVKLRLSGENISSLTEATEEVRKRLGEYIVAEDEDTLETTVARLLIEQRKTVSVAESCSGGLLAKRLTDLPGSSAYFLGGAVTYSNDAKSAILNIPSALIERFGAVSEEVAEAMSDGIRRIAGSDISLAVTGIAGPSGGSDEKPVGTVFIALSDSEGRRVKKLRLGGSRDQIRTATVYHAMDRLRRYLSGQSADKGSALP